MRLVLSGSWRGVLKGVLVAAVSVAATACSGARPASTDAGGGGAGGSGGSHGDGGSSAGGPGGSGGIGGINFTGSGGGGGDPGCARCSADLHDVVDCNGQVLKSCPPDTGCGPNGECVSPCEAAVANGSTIGCDFYSAVPATLTVVKGPCFAALIANTWGTPVDLGVELGGMKLDLDGLARVPSGGGNNLDYSPLSNGKLGPGELALLFLSAAPNGSYKIGCPAGVTPGVTVDPALATTGIGQAFHITSSAPVVAYDIFPYGGATSFVTSATLLLPTSAWGKNYVANMPWAVDPTWASINEYPYVQVVAAEDNTKVTIGPTSDILAGPGVEGSPAGQPKDYTLNRGHILQLLQPADLSGSPIATDKPVGVWSGASNTHIDVGVAAGDSAHQQLPPVSALGHEYLGVRYRDRTSNFNESIPYTLVGAVDGTALEYDPAPPMGAPLSLSKGQKVTFKAADPFVVKSQDKDHPIYFAAHMTGSTSLPFDPMNSNPGDPEYVNVVPPAQHLSSYLFLTDPTYSNTHLVFTRQKTKDGSLPEVELDCLGKVEGWQPIGNSGTYEYARVDMVLNGAPVGNCNNGVHTAKSTAPFGLTVWGWDHSVSYAYPAGMSLQPINTVIVTPEPK